MHFSSSLKINRTLHRLEDGNRKIISGVAFQWPHHHGTETYSLIWSRRYQYHRRQLMPLPGQLIVTIFQCSYKYASTSTYFYTQTCTLLLPLPTHIYMSFFWTYAIWNETYWSQKGKYLSFKNNIGNSFKLNFFFFSSIFMYLKFT